MKIAAVIVTFNRLDKLKKALSAYETQVTPVDDLIVVDNCSTDGTDLFLKDWKNASGVSKRHVVYMEENLGGAGGFHDGCEYAMTLNPDWVFVADDDAYPDIELISRFKAFVEKNGADGISAICGSVLDINGNIAMHHRRTLNINCFFRIRVVCSEPADYQKESFVINQFSYVGTFMRVSSLRRVGLCNRDFFIYFDDGEHSLRMSKDGKILCVPQLKIVHDDGFSSEKKNNGNIIPLWRSYYQTRNNIYTYLHHYPIVGIKIAILLFATSLFLGKTSKKSKKMVRTAVKDALFNKLGKHPLYRP